MKKNILVLFIALISFTYVNAQSTWNYIEFAEVRNSSGTLFTLEYGIKSSGYNGYVKWRITNHNNTTVYNVSIADKEYTLSNGKKVSRSGGSITSTLGPGESKTTMSDAVNSDEHGGFGAKPNPATLTRLSLEQPMVKFAAEKYGTKYGWDSAGTVRKK